MPNVLVGVKVNKNFKNVDILEVLSDKVFFNYIWGVFALICLWLEYACVCYCVYVSSTRRWLWTDCSFNHIPSLKDVIFSSVKAGWWSSCNQVYLLCHLVLFWPTEFEQRPHTAHFHFHFVWLNAVCQRLWLVSRWLWKASPTDAALFILPWTISRSWMDSTRRTAKVCVHVYVCVRSCASLFVQICNRALI